MKSRLRSLKTAFILLFTGFLSVNMMAQDNKGNPLPHFLYPSFKEGLVVMKDGKKFSTLLNYNMVEERMITEINGTYRYSKDPQLIDSIYLEDRVFVPVDKVFYEILSTGPTTFYLQNKSKFISKGADVGYGVKSHSIGSTQMKQLELSWVIFNFGEVAYVDLPPNVDVSPISVLWVGKNEKFEKFSTEKQLLKIFPEYSSELKDYIKKESIKLKSREDVIRLGNYYNEIAQKTR